VATLTPILGLPLEPVVIQLCFWLARARYLAGSDWLGSVHRLALSA
jgi:hypothetical protein